MTHTRQTARTCFVEVDGDQFVYRRWGNTKMKFTFLLQAPTKLLQCAARKNLACACYIRGKPLVLQTWTAEGSGRHFHIANGPIFGARWWQRHTRRSLREKRPARALPATGDENDPKRADKSCPPVCSGAFPRYASIPVARIGRLAIDLAFQGQKLGGASLADAALRAAR